MERQITFAPHGHILTNAHVWSPDGRRLVYDVRSDPAGASFDGTRIETVDIQTGHVRVLYESQRGACCGVATYHPIRDRVVFILGPEDPNPEFTYGSSRRRGVMVDEDRPGAAIALDARDLSAPFTPGALRGGSHVHVFSADGTRLSFTYEDHVLETGAGERNQRNVGVSLLDRAVAVPKTHPRNHDGTAFSVLVTRTVDQPTPGSDEICRAFEEAWVGVRGYVRRDGSHQRWALAFQGEVITPDGQPIREVFVADIPEDLTLPSEDGPLEGAESLRPRPPAGCRQRRLTSTVDRRFPGLQGPRHWLRSSPDGRQIAFLMRDDAGIIQLWCVSPEGESFTQLSRNASDLQSCFSWSPDGRRIAFVQSGEVCTLDIHSGVVRQHTDGGTHAAAREEACVFSPDGSKIAYVRPVDGWNQVFVCTVDS